MGNYSVFSEDGGKKKRRRRVPEKLGQNAYMTCDFWSNKLLTM